MRSFTFASKWLSLVAAVWILLVNSGGYNFGVYSEVVKLSLGYTQKTITTVAFFRDLGSNFGLLSGILFDYGGPQVVLIVAACLNFVGNFVLWLIVTRKLGDPGVVVVSFLFFIANNAQAFAFSASVITSVKNFPLKRGMIVGVVVSFVGLSGAVMAFIFEAIYPQRTEDFLLFNSWISSGVFILCFPLVQVQTHDNSQDEDQSKRFHGFSTFSLGIAAFLFIFILFKMLFNIDRTVQRAITGIMVVGLITGPGLIIFITRQHLNEVHGEATKEPPSKAKLVEVFEAKTDVTRAPERGANFTTWQALKCMDMWLIVLASTCGYGSVLTALDNIGQIAKAWGYSTRQTTNSMTFNNLWSFMGRIGVGWLSELLLQKYATPRPLVFAGALTFASIGHLIVALKPSPVALMLACAFEGFSLGGILALILTMISELFGLKNFAVLSNVGILVPTVVGTYMFSVRLVGNMFDQASQRQDHTCIGITCYRQSFLVMAGICLVGVFLSLILAFRTKSFYTKLSKPKPVESDDELE